MSAQHTPGPWVVDGPDHFNDYTVHPADRQLAIAAIVNGAINDLSGRGVEHDANARLIAAAPDLLEALDESYSELAADSLRDGPRCLLLTKIEAAIAKARGQ